jgi:hypothetical protein
MLHYYPRHVSSINMPIFRRTNCIITASGIVALCKRLRSTPVESRLQSTLNWCTAQPFTESDDTRCCDNIICPPEDGHVNAHVKASSVTYILLMNKELCIKVDKRNNPPLSIKFVCVCVCVYKEHLYQFSTLNVTICTFICMQQSFFYLKSLGTAVHSHRLQEQFQ